MSTNDGTISNEVEPGLDGLLPLSIARSQTETATTRLPSVKRCGHATRAGLNVDDRISDGIRLVARGRCSPVTIAIGANARQPSSSHYCLTTPQFKRNA